MLHYAVEGGNKEMVTALLRDGLGPAPAAAFGRELTPLHLAARAGHAELVRILLEAGYIAAAPDPQVGLVPWHAEL